MKIHRLSNNLFKDWALVILLALLVIFFSICEPRFFSVLNLKNILIQNSHVAILAMGTSLIMISGAVDLSQGYQISTIAVVMTLLITTKNVPVFAAAVIGIGIGILFSVINMLLSLWLKAHPMIITLATMAVFEGVSYTISNARTFINLPRSFLYVGQGSLWGIPLNFLLMLLIVLFTVIFLEKTYIGKRIYACGDNNEAARLAGIKVIKIKLGVFAFAGALTGIAALVLAARSGSANSSTGVGMEFTAITACVLGGVALQGGEGKPWKVLIAVYVLGVLANGMQFIGLGTYAQYIVKGILMLFSVGLSNNVFMLKSKTKRSAVSETKN